MAAWHQFDPSNTTQTWVNTNTERHIELSTWNERDEAIHQHAGDRRGGRESNDGAQWNCTANLLQDLLLLWWFFVGPLLYANSGKRDKRWSRRESYLQRRKGQVILKYKDAQESGPPGKDGGLDASYRATNNHRSVCRSKRRIEMWLSQLCFHHLQAEGPLRRK